MAILKNIYIIAAQVVFWLVVNHILLSGIALFMDQEELMKKTILSTIVYTIISSLLFWLIVIPMLVDALVFGAVGSMLEKTMFDRDIIKEREKEELIEKQSRKILELEKELKDQGRRESNELAKRMLKKTILRIKPTEEELRIAKLLAKGLATKETLENTKADLNKVSELADYFIQEDVYR